MEKTENLNGIIALLAIVSIAAALIVVFQRSEKERSFEIETLSEYSTIDETESISAEVRELISERRSVREEVSSMVAAAEASLTEPFKSLSKPFNETATTAPTTEAQVTTTEAYIEDDVDFEYQNGDIPGDYIGDPDECIQFGRRGANVYYA